MSKLTPEVIEARKRAFLAAFAETGRVDKAAEAVGIHRGTHYKWLRDDPDYPERFRQAEQEAARTLEDEAVRRATEGLRRYKFDKQGNPLINPETGEPYYEHEYSDTLLIFLLKGILPEKYKERVAQEVNQKTQVVDNESTEILRELVQDPTIAERIKNYYRQRTNQSPRPH